MGRALGKLELIGPFQYLVLYYFVISTSFLGEGERVRFFGYMGVIWASSIRSLYGINMKIGSKDSPQ